MTSDEADALAGRAKTVSAQHYVLHDLKSFADKYLKAWTNLGVKIPQDSPYYNRSFSWYCIYIIKECRQNDTEFDLMRQVSVN